MPPCQLSCQLLQLAQQLALAQLLEAEQTRLQAEHQLLLECCDGMALLRLRSSQHDDAGGYAAGELALLQQLQVRLLVSCMVFNCAHVR
jgi:hypothetical protein